MRRWLLPGALAVCVACSGHRESGPAIGDAWTDPSVFEVAWWRDYRWTVVTKTEATDASAWLLRPETAADGSWPDVSIGVIDVRSGEHLSRASWFSRGWVAKAHRVSLAVTRAPDPSVVAVTERFADEDGILGVNEYFYRLNGTTLSLVDEVVTVDPAAERVRQYAFKFVPGPTLTFETVVEDRVTTFALDPRTNRFRVTRGH